MNLIILTDTDNIGQNLYSVKDDRARHIIEILKSEAGDTLKVGLLNNGIGNAKVKRIGDSEVLLECTELQPQKGIHSIDLICALPRPQTVKKVLFIAGMTGIRNLYFIRANRVEKSYFHSPLLSDEKMLKYLIEGMTQGGNIFLPKITIHNKFRTFIEDEFPAIEKREKKDSVYLMTELSGAEKLSPTIVKNSQNFVVAIGPEGGWVDFEIDKFINCGFEKIKLSDAVLRVEHALMAVIAQIELLR